jgi:hypothetical protein
MTPVKTYPTEVEANLARIKLEAAGITSLVVGVGMDMKGGMGGVQLLVADELAEEASLILADD